MRAAAALVGSAVVGSASVTFGYPSDWRSAGGRKPGWSGACVCPRSPGLPPLHAERVAGRGTGTPPSRHLASLGKSLACSWRRSMDAMICRASPKRQSTR
jgi:hypothetical protein